MLEGMGMRVFILRMLPSTVLLRENNWRGRLYCCGNDLEQFYKQEEGRDNVSIECSAILVGIRHMFMIILVAKPGCLSVEVVSSRDV